jgi:hypothetical protein
MSLRTSAPESETLSKQGAHMSSSIALWNSSIDFRPCSYPFRHAPLLPLLCPHWNKFGLPCLPKTDQTNVGNPIASSLGQQSASLHPVPSFPAIFKPSAPISAPGAQGLAAPHILLGNHTILHILVLHTVIFD